MPVKIINVGGSKMLEVHFSGKLVQGDCEQFLLEIRKLVQRANLPVLIDMTELGGVAPDCLLPEDLFFESHFTEIKRLAAIGDTLWQKTMAALSKPFTSATVRYFTPIEAEKARIWLVDG